MRVESIEFNGAAISSGEKLGESFYLRDAVTVAKDLIGKIFVRKFNGEFLSGIITETEAYIENDEASHSFGGMRNRNKVMFDRGGKLYVYFIYGVHYCANIVTANKGIGEAVLLRAMQPLTGLEIMAENRFGKKEITEREKINLLNGPAKICKAFGITKRHNGFSVLGDDLFLLEDKSIADFEIESGTRIGISKSTDLPWRFFMKNNKYVSR